MFNHSSNVSKENLVVAQWGGVGDRVSGTHHSSILIIKDHQGHC